MVGSRVKDMWSQYSNLVGDLARQDVRGVEYRFQCDAKEKSLRKLL
jgi:hypothetical protein